MVRNPKERRRLMKVWWDQKEPGEKEDESEINL
jgi:hypothetical protein